MDLFNNDICNIEDYRTKVFKLLPNLKFLDDADADDNDEEESDDEGANGAEEGDEDDGEGGHPSKSKQTQLISRKKFFLIFQMMMTKWKARKTKMIVTNLAMTKVCSICI